MMDPSTGTNIDININNATIYSNSSQSPGPERLDLQWSNVLFAFTFILSDAILSRSFGLGIGRALITSAIRCITQLSIMALILQSIFDARNPWGVAGLAFLLNLLGTFEVVLNNSKRRFRWMFFIVLTSMLCSTIPVSIIGSKFAMSVKPFWIPNEYIPVLGMLCGNAISGISLSINFILREIHENKDKIETYLSYGATRFEACRPVAKEAIRLALMSPINQMSVIGIISIPGTMTGAILGGFSVQQAARLQMVMMFMIVASAALSSILVTCLTLVVVVDSGHRLRNDRIDGRKHPLWRFIGEIRKVFLSFVQNWWMKAFIKARSFISMTQKERGDDEQNSDLLGIRP